MYGEHQLTHEPARGHDFVSGMLFGAAIGAAVGLLFAPRAGSELRGQIVHSAERFRQRASEGVQQATATVNETVERGQEAWQKGRETVNETVERGQEAWQKGRETFDQVRSSHT